MKITFSEHNPRYYHGKLSRFTEPDMSTKMPPDPQVGNVIYGLVGVLAAIIVIGVVLFLYINQRNGRGKNLNIPEFSPGGVSYSLIVSGLSRALRKPHIWRHDVIQHRWSMVNQWNIDPKLWFYAIICRFRTLDSSQVELFWTFQINNSSQIDPSHNSSHSNQVSTSVGVCLNIQRSESVYLENVCKVNRDSTALCLKQSEVLGRFHSTVTKNVAAAFTL